jgi:hypothetical protein
MVLVLFVDLKIQRDYTSTLKGGRRGAFSNLSLNLPSVVGINTFMEG